MNAEILGRVPRVEPLVVACCRRGVLTSAVASRTTRRSASSSSTASKRFAPAVGSQLPRLGVPRSPCWIRVRRQLEGTGCGLARLTSS